MRMLILVLTPENAYKRNNVPCFSHLLRAITTYQFNHPFPSSNRILVLPAGLPLIVVGAILTSPTFNDQLPFEL